jgi:predicted enzyme related to lactoylglutathione lyase
MKLEVVIIPVSDVERAKEFYERLGWRLDVTPPGITRFTPHGSGCSVQLRKDELGQEAPGSAKAYLIVSDIEAARDKLVAAGIKVSEIFHIGTEGRVNGPDPEHRSYRSRASFSDPDGNNWLLQEVTTRPPGRIDPGQRRSGARRPWPAASWSRGATLDVVDHLAIEFERSTQLDQRVYLALPGDDAVPRSRCAMFPLQSEPIPHRKWEQARDGDYS